MEANPETSQAISQLVQRTYQAMSTPDGDLADVFRAADVSVAGSGKGELFYGSDQVIGAARGVASRGWIWGVDQIKVWCRGDVAWAQILGHIEVARSGVTEQVGYVTTGVFGREPEGWQWLYWGGCQPRDEPLA